MNKRDRETAVLRHLLDGPKPTQDFDQGLREWQRRAGDPMDTPAIGGIATVERCWRAGWVEPSPDGLDPTEPWQITDEGQAELKRRTA